MKIKSSFFQLHKLPLLAGLFRSLRDGFWNLIVLFLIFVSIAACLGCKKAPPPSAQNIARLSAITVETKAGGPATLKSGTAEFDILPSGYLQAFLLRDGNRLALDEPETGPESSSDALLISGKEMSDFTFDFDHVKISDSQGKLGPLGKRVEISAHSSNAALADIEKLLTVEIYDDFPTVALTTVTYKNVGTKEIKVDRVITQRRRLNAALADSVAAPYDLWSFQGSSYDWGKDEILRISKNFSQPNVMGGPGPKGQGGGIPVVDFWTGKMGEAVGHLETLPLVLSMPVQVKKDGRISVSMQFEPTATLKPGEVYSTPNSFVMVHSGDFYEPLQVWSKALQRRGWVLPKPTNADYSANWCGWGYEANVTPVQMLGILPKLKELNLQTATLDYCWFNNFGDWEPRSDTFPIEAIKGIVNEYHKQGILITLWWQPLGVEDGQGKPSLGKPMSKAKLITEHPEWMILDKSGNRARLISPVCTVAAMCPALAEVRQYHKELTERFIRDWGFDGNKMDSVFSVPLCYNPKHQHKSPEDSINAVAELYRVIFETTRALKPESVTQICPCGTTPSQAWLPYEDQAVTADPVGSVQVRRRIKMYKALLGPQAAVYGDHVELSGMKRVGNDWLESGKDFASTVGTGGVVGTKFTWPGDAPDPRLRKVKLTSEKEVLWKKWIGLYNTKMLSRGVFRNLYTHGYDTPEGYVIEKDGKTYYAFFSPEPERAWRGEIELRGLPPGKHRVSDYENQKDLGVLDSTRPRLTAEFKDHLLLEVGPE